MPIPTIGDDAPDFDVLTDRGDRLKLSDLRGKKVVLYFYPQSDTPGCTRQACKFRDNYNQFEALGVIVLGASPDTVQAQADFKTKYQLPFTLLADADHQVADLYGQWGTHNLSFKGVAYTMTGVLRSTFIIDERGVIMDCKLGVDPTTNTADVLEILSQ